MAQSDSESDVSVHSPNDKKSAKKQQKTRHTWTKEETLKLLRLWRYAEGWKTPVKNRGPMWYSFANDLKKENLDLSARAVRDRINSTIATHRKENPKNERKTGDPEDEAFDEKEQLLIEIVQLEKEFKEKTGAVKSLADEKRDRAEEKLMLAAKHGLKKRPSHAEDSMSEQEKEEIELGYCAPRPFNPINKRNSWQKAVGSFFEKKTADSEKQSALELKKLDIEQEKIRLEEKKLEMEAAKQADFLKDQEAAREERKMMAQALLRIVERLN